MSIAYSFVRRSDVMAYSFVRGSTVSCWSIDVIAPCLEESRDSMFIVLVWRSCVIGNICFVFAGDILS